MRDRYECALRDLLVPQLQNASPVPIFVTLPREARALAVAQATLRNPAESKPTAALCAEVGVSVRTIERAFRREVGTDFESWRRQVRLTHRTTAKTFPWTQRSGKAWGSQPALAVLTDASGDTTFRGEGAAGQGIVGAVLPGCSAGI